MTKQIAPTAAEQAEALSYTHSPWSGRKYSRPQTHAEMTAEGLAVLDKHPTIGRMLRAQASMTLEERIAADRATILAAAARCAKR